MIFNSCMLVTNLVRNKLVRGIDSKYRAVKKENNGKTNKQ